MFQINSKQTKEFYKLAEDIKSLEETLGQKLYDVGIHQDFLEIILMLQ